MKICTICQEVKDEKEFYFNRLTNKLIAACKTCHQKSNKRWKENNAEKVKLNNRLWQQRNPEKTKKGGKPKIQNWPNKELKYGMNFIENIIF